MKIIALWLIGALFFLMGISGVHAGPDDIDHQVAIVLDKAKSGDLSYVYPLCKKEGSQVLPAFAKHILDPNSDVRWAVEIAAASFQTDEARETLISLVGDKETTVSEHALRSLDRIYSRKVLQEDGGKRLQEQLLYRLNHDPSAQSIAMLSYFDPSPQVISDLKQYRKKSEGTQLDLEVWLPVDASLTIVMTLSEMGDQESLAEFQQRLRAGPATDAESALGLLPFVTTRAVLAPCVELLKDNRETRRIRGGLGFGPKESIPPPVTYLRVCDLALIWLVAKTGIDVGVDPNIGNSRPFTEAEIATAYARLNAYVDEQK